METDRTGPLFETSAERTAFRAEIESTLSAGDIDDLRDGKTEVLATVVEDGLDEVDQLRLALAYFQHADIQATNDVLRAVADRLVDAEQAENHTDGLRGPIH